MQFYQNGIFQIQPGSHCFTEGLNTLQNIFNKIHFSWKQNSVTRSTVTFQITGKVE